MGRHQLQILGQKNSCRRSLIKRLPAEENLKESGTRTKRPPPSDSPDAGSKEKAIKSDCRPTGDPVVDKRNSTEGSDDEGIAPLENDASMEEREPTVVETESGPSDYWQTVTKKIRSKPEARSAIAAKKPNDTARDKRTVYVRGRQGYNLAKEVTFKDATDFKKAIHSLAADYDSMQLVGDSIRITMKTEQQAQQLLPVDTISGKSVSATLPRRLQRQNDAAHSQLAAQTSEQ